jgi:DNA-binding transcriptional regulator YiaG
VLSRYQFKRQELEECTSLKVELYVPTLFLIFGNTDSLSIYMRSEYRDRVERMDSSVRTLFFWRHENGLSQVATVAFFRGKYFDLTLSALRSWESGRTRPRSHTKELLEEILREYPKTHKREPE